MSIRAVIAEDDDFLRQDLIDNISKYEGIEIAYSTNNGKDLLKAIKKIKPEIIVTDIDMPHMTGIDAVKEIRKEIPYTELIFITSYSDYIKDAVQLYACDFIEKPLDTIRLRNTIERIKERYVLTDNVIFFSTKESTKCVHINELYFIEAINNKTKVYTSSGSFISMYSMKKVNEMLSDDIFFRTNRSYIVNLLKVSEIQVSSRYCYEINFQNEDEVAYLSKKNYQDFRERLEEVYK